MTSQNILFLICVHIKCRLPIVVHLILVNLENLFSFFYSDLSRKKLISKTAKTDGAKISLITWFRISLVSYITADQAEAISIKYFVSHRPLSRKCG